MFRIEKKYIILFDCLIDIILKINIVNLSYNFICDISIGFEIYKLDL